MLRAYWKDQLTESIVEFKAVGLLLWRYLRSEQLTVSAGYLAYVTTLSLVPVMMVFVTIMSAFPGFTALRIEFESFVFQNFVPNSGLLIRSHMMQFVENATSTGSIGMLALLFVAIMLVASIDKTINRIWRITRKRPPVVTLAIYWTLITLGPLLIGASLGISAYFLRLASAANEYLPFFSELLLNLVPILAKIVVFTLVYTQVPNTVVPLKVGLFGAVTTCVLFELLAAGFSVFVNQFSSYQLIYGALAAIPVLLLWIYLSWLVILFGATLCYCMWQHAQECQKGCK